MYKAKREYYSLGTVVFIEQHFINNNAALAVVIDKDFWKKRVAEENPFLLEEFKEDYIPLRILGVRIGNKFFSDAKNSEEPYEEYIVHYAYTKVGIGLVMQGPEDTKLLSAILKRVNRFNDVNPGYFSQVMHELKILKIYLSGNYDLNDPKVELFDRKLLTLFEKCIPK